MSNTTLERVQIVGNDWQLINLNTLKLNDIQNCTNVQCEWSYNNDIESGSIFPAGEILRGIRQKIYIKANTIPQKGFISIVENDMVLSSTNVLGNVALQQGGNQALIDVFGKLATSTLTRQIGLKFDKKLNSETEVDIVGTPIAQYNGTIGRLQNGDSISTQNLLIYEAGDGVEILFTAAFETTTGDFRFCYRNIFADAGIGTVGTAPDIKELIDLSSYDMTKMFIFRITYGYLGVAPIKLEIKPENSEEPFKTVYVHETNGVLEQRTHIGSPSVPMRAESTASGVRIGAFDDYSGVYLELDNISTLFTGSWSSKTYTTGSSLQVQPQFAYGAREVGVDFGEESALVAFRIKDTLNGFPNNIISELVEFEVATGSEGLYSINFYKNPIGTLTATWADANADYSPAEISKDVEFTPDISDKIRYAKALTVGSKAVGSLDTDFKNANLVGRAGDIFVVTKSCDIAGGGDDVTRYNILFKDRK